MPHLERQKVKKRFLSREIKRQRREGKPQKQSVAIAFSKARKRFGNRSLQRSSNRRSR